MSLLVSLRLWAAPSPSDEDFSSIALFYLPCSDTITWLTSSIHHLKPIWFWNAAKCVFSTSVGVPYAWNFTTKLRDNIIQPFCSCTLFRSGLFARSRSLSDTYRFFPLASATPSALCWPLGTVVCFMPLCFLFWFHQLASQSQHVLQDFNILWSPKVVCWS